MKTEFEIHQHLGVLTSIPFLALLPDQKTRVRSHHWVLGYVHESLERAYGNAYQIGVYEPENDITEKSEADAQQKSATMHRLSREIALFNFCTGDESFSCPPKATRSEFETIQRAWQKAVSETSVLSPLMSTQRTTTPPSSEGAPTKRKRISYP